MPDDAQRPVSAPATPGRILPGNTVMMQQLGDHLAKLSQDHRKFLEAKHPLTASIWLALMRPAGDVVRAQADIVRIREAGPESAQNVNNGTEAPEEPDERNPAHAPSQAERPAILLLGEALVAQALLGSEKAVAQIADRIEGKVGVRKEDQDPESAARRQDMQAFMEAMARTWHAAAAQPGDRAAVVDANVEVG